MKKSFKYASIALISLFFFNCSGDDDSPNPDPQPDPGAEDTVVLTNILNVPWELVWGPDNYLWFTEREGRVSRIHPDTKAQELILTIDSVVRTGESGLLGMVFHPDFANNPYIYMVYTYNDGTLQERLVRYTYAKNVLSDELILLEGIPASTNHDGSRILITPDSHIIMTTGDAGNNTLSQDMNSLAGKILRINLDGSVPSDNPFSDSYIYSLGHRNPQGLYLHANGKMYSSEHGPSTDDEINIITAGKNYGWPHVMGVIDSSSEENFAATTPVVESIFNWTPTIAVSDITFYTSTRIPQWTNKLLVTALKDQKIIALTLSSDGASVVKEEVFFEGDFGRVRDIAVSPQGRVFIASNGAQSSGTANTHSVIEINRIK